MEKNQNKISKLRADVTGDLNEVGKVMRILQVNIFGNLSTGRIATDLYRTLAANGEEGCVAFARNMIPDDVPHIIIGNSTDVKVHGLMTRITDKTGFYSKRATRKFIQKIEEYKPDVIHLHNIHGYYINIELLFNYLKETQIPVVWTLHDCWAFTGHCCYYSMANCDRWKTGCYDCPQKKAYPASLIMDNSEWNYKKKKELFTGVNMHLVAVSKWLAGQVKESFLRDYPLSVIYNGIDLSVFKPTESDFKKKYGIEDKKVVLGVASTWDVRKGLNDFIELSKLLPEDYKVVVVGVNQKEQLSLSDNMLGLSRTDSMEELAGIYTAADFFFNASVEETFGLPTVEAMACGSPVIVYDATALPEVVSKSVGYVVKSHDLQRVVNIISTKSLEVDIDDCIQEAGKFEKSKQYDMYLKLYKEMLRGNENCH